jgi:hypothetical protein
MKHDLEIQVATMVDRRQFVRIRRQAKTMTLRFRLPKFASLPKEAWHPGIF